MTRLGERVWLLLAQIPKGTVTTYGAIATALGVPRASRAVARACATNPRPYVLERKLSRSSDNPALPCHRVVMSDGRIGGYSGPGGVRTKIVLLEIEGVQVRNGRIVGFSARLWNPSMPSDV